MSFINSEFRRASVLIITFMMFMISAPSFAQDTESLDGSTEEDPTDRLIEQYEGTAVGKVLAWLLEYRWYAMRFLGLAVFADSAKVFENGDDTHDALFTDFHPAYGAGLRITIPPEIIVRIDFGMSHEQTNTYFTLGESF